MTRWTRRMLLATVLSVGFLTNLVPSGRAQEQATPRVSAAEFDKLFQLIQPQPGESRWMEIAWYPSVWEARQKAAQEGKPLFLWAGSGGAPAAGC
ncbi:MAG: hypothetical protein LC104_17535 [Bacteroidales bacterium]|nr:hypothetical protein [Bacteroidales bacterium]